MHVINTDFDEVKIIRHEKMFDKRGFRTTVFKKDTFEKIGFSFDIVEERIYCPQINAFFGIHFQNNPSSQNKLISLLSGVGLDFIIDLRRKSNTYKKWIKIELNSNENLMIFIPHGFGHAFLSKSENVKISYKIDEYHNEYSKAISYKDPEINLCIQINEELISDQDKYAPFLKDSDCNL